MDQAIASLRWILVQKPSPQGWKKLLQVLQSMKDVSQQSLVIDYCEPYLEAWPDNLRFLRAHNLHDLESPWWKLIRSCNLSIQAQEFSPTVYEKLQKIVHLSFQDSKQLEQLSGIERCNNLKSLHLGGCTQLKSLLPLKELVFLEELNISSSAVESFEPLFVLSKLKVLNMAYTRLKTTENFESFSVLEELQLAHCRELYDVESLKKCKALKVLNLNHCMGITEIKSLGKLGLEEIHLHGLELKSYVFLNRFSGLKKLSLGSCNQDPKMIFTQMFPTIEWLDLRESSFVQYLSFLYFFPNLRKLFLDSCTNLVSLKGLSKCFGLEFLSISGCYQLKSLKELCDLPLLKKLFFEGFRTSRLPVKPLKASMKSRQEVEDFCKRL